MVSLDSILNIAHFAGLALAIGAATVKLTALLKARADHSLVPAYIRLTKVFTRQILVGLALLILSGVGWLLLGYPFTSLLVVKIALVAAIFVLGPVIDNVAEPRFRALAPAEGQAAQPGFDPVVRRYVALEATATLLFYIVLVVWVLR